MDRIITATEANQRFSEMLRDVAGGDSFTVTSRGKAVARMVPAEEKGGQQAVERLLKHLRSLPRRDAGPWAREDLYD